MANKPSKTRNSLGVKKKDQISIPIVDLVNSGAIGVDADKRMSSQIDTVKRKKNNNKIVLTPTPEYTAFKKDMIAYLMEKEKSSYSKLLHQAKGLEMVDDTVDMEELLPKLDNVDNVKESGILDSIGKFRESLQPSQVPEDAIVDLDPDDFSYDDIFVGGDDTRSPLGFVRPVEPSTPRKSSGKKEKKKTIEDEVSEKFNPIRSQVNNNILEIAHTLNSVDNEISRLSSKDFQRARGRDTALANYFTAKTQLLNASQSALKQLTDIEIKTFDIAAKKAKDTKSEQDSAQEILNKILPELIGNKATRDSVNNSMLSAAMGGMDGDGGTGYDHSEYYDYPDPDYYADELEERMRNPVNHKGQPVYVSDYDRNIEFEGKFDVAIKLAWTTGEWIFVAVNKGSTTINRNIPQSMLPTKTGTQIKFDEEKGIATDVNRPGSVYKLISVPTL